MAAGLFMAFTVTGTPLIFLAINIGMWAVLAEEMPRKAKPVNMYLTRTQVSTCICSYQASHDCLTLLL